MGKRLITAVVAMVVAVVAGCTSPSPPAPGSAGMQSAPASTSATQHPSALTTTAHPPNSDASRLTPRLPLLADLPDMAQLTYRVPAEHGLFYDNGRWSECGHYPEVGDLSGSGVQAEYDSVTHSAWPVFFVRLRSAVAGEDVAGELAAWVKRCGERFSVGGQDYVASLGNAGMPAGTTLLTVTNTKHLGMTGDWGFGPPSVRIAVTASEGVAFEAWAVADGVDGQQLERQLASMARSFQRRTTPDTGKPVAQWTPAELSRLFVLPGQSHGSIDIAVPNGQAGTPRTDPPPAQVCAEDPLRPSSYAGLSSSYQPAGVDPLVRFAGSYPGAGQGAPVTVIYREHAGVDYLARMREWTSSCRAHPAAVPQVCIPGRLQPDFVPVTAETIEGEVALGYQRFEPKEASGGHGGQPYCVGTAQAARTMRVAGLLIQTEMAVDATDGPPDWAAALQPLEAQLADVIRAIHHAR
ncbi:hypothetical protein E2F47_11885 [Mycobacterium eburneum]|nr:hypothetical protein E2F47_11885 [Mycobacterium eburneum]